MESAPTLEEQRKRFASSKLLAMPLAGLIAWMVVGICGMYLPALGKTYVLFAATGSIVYLGMFLSKFTGEYFLDKKRPKNAFDTLFFYTTAQAVLVYAIAIPFFLVDYTSLPLTVGILTGLMWIPLSWIIQHWVGIFHTGLRTALIVSFWYLFPNERFVAIPFAICGVYLMTIFVLLKRWKEFNENSDRTMQNH